MVQNFLCFFGRNLDSEIHKTPSKIITFKFTVSICIHCWKDSLKASDTEGRFGKDFWFHVFDKINDVKLGKLSNWSCVAGIWGCVDQEAVLALNIFRWNINCYSSVFLKCKILWFVIGLMIKTVNFIFSTKIILRFKFVTWCKINAGWNMSD